MTKKQNEKKKKTMQKCFNALVKKVDYKWFTPLNFYKKYDKKLAEYLK